MDPKLKSLVNVAELQIKIGHLFVEAERIKASGDYATAHPVYNDCIATMRDLLDASLDFNKQFPESPYEIPPVAQPLVNTLLTDADIVQAMGDRGASEALRQEALEVSLVHLGRKSTAHAERDRATALIGEGRFNEAIMALMGARDALLKEKSPIDLARVTIDLAGIYQWLGDFRRAKEEIELAEKEIEKAQKKIESRLGGRQPTQIDLLTGLVSSISSIVAGRGDPGDAQLTADLYRAGIEVILYRGYIAKALKEWDEAERCFNRVLPEYQSLGVGESIEYQLAGIKIGRGQFREALEQLRRLEHVFDRGDFRPKRSAFQRAQAKCLQALGESSEALRLVEDSITDLTERHFDPDVLWSCQWLKAQIYDDQGDKKQALKSFEDSLKTIAYLRRAPLGYRLDSTYLEDKKEFYTDAIGRSLQAEAPLQCCQFMESIKSRTLTAVLSIPAEDDSAATALEDEFHSVTRQLDAIEYQAYREGWRGHRPAYNEKLKERADLIERIRISDPRWRNLSEPIEIDLEKLLPVLSKRSQAALTLYYEPPDLTAVLLFDGRITANQLTVSNDTANNLADYAKNLQQKKDYDPLRQDLSVQYSVLAEHLIPPSFLSQVLTAKSLIVVPHGLLHLVPWAGLLHMGARLFEYLPIGVLPNLGVLNFAADISRPRQVALVGVSASPDLDEKFSAIPSAGDEIRDIRKVYEGAAVVIEPLLDDAATEEAFWKMTRNVKGTSNILHVSCHGLVSPDEPMSSGLLLYDSKIDAAELARAKLPFEEVVLSDCSTGWRPTEVGDVVLSADEILAIPAGILESGVRSVLVSIPKAEGKSARELTTHYHQRRVAGDSPLMAFQSAQKHLLGQHVTPSLWLGFALYGCV